MLKHTRPFFSGGGGERSGKRSDGIMHGSVIHNSLHVAPRGIPEATSIRVPAGLEKAMVTRTMGMLDVNYWESSRTSINAINPSHLEFH